jgi:hypothetical protein
MISLKALLMEGMGIDRAFKGTARGGAAVLTVVDNFRVYKGSNIYTAKGSLPIYTIVGNKLFKGDKIAGVPIANLSGNKVFKGSNVYGMPIATIVRDTAFKGMALGGLPLVTVPSGNPLALMVAAYHILNG